MTGSPQSVPPRRLLRWVLIALGALAAGGAVVVYWDYYHAVRNAEIETSSQGR